MKRRAFFKVIAGVLACVGLKIKDSEAEPFYDHQFSGEEIAYSWMDETRPYHPMCRCAPPVMTAEEWIKLREFAENEQ